MLIEKAFKKLIITSPFYGIFCLGLPKTITTEIQTLCVRKRGIDVELCINPEFWNTLSDEEQLAVLQHELAHIAFHHMFLQQSFNDATLFNICADLEVNSYINNLPKDALFPENFGLGKELGVKAYYKILENKIDTSKFAQQLGDSHACWDDFVDCSDAQKQLIESRIDSATKMAAETVQKNRGTLPGGISEIVAKLLEKRPEIFNWKLYFRKLLGSIYDINIRSTRRKVSKRFEGNAGIQHKKKVSILVAVDTSGSVSTKELQEFFAEITYIYKAGARVTIIECDTIINKIVEYDGKNIPEIIGRGGTDFNAPIEYYLKHKRDYASLIYFTDGECSLPFKHPSGLVWVITPNGRHQDYPGKTIYIPSDAPNKQ